MKRTLFALIALVGFAPLVGGAAPATAAELSVAHGIPGEDLGLDPALPVDIALDGACTVPGLEFGTVAGPLTVDPGTYFVEVRLTDGGGPCEGTLVISGDVSVNFGDNATVVANLTTDGAILLNKFVNDLRALDAPGTGRLVVRHVADAPAVDLYVRSQGLPLTQLFSNLENPEQVKAEVDPGLYAVGLTPAGESTPVFGPVPLDLAPDAATFVYAVGTLDTGSFTVLVQSFDL